MTRLLPVIILQALTLCAVFLAWWSLAPNVYKETSADRGAALFYQGEYAAAELAYERATLGESPVEAAAYQDMARLSEAYLTITAPTLPDRSQLPRLKALADVLMINHARGARLLRLVALRIDGRLTEAAELGAQLVESSDSPWARWHLAGVRLQQTRTAEAIELLEQVVKAKPEFGAGYHQLGRAYAASKQTEAGIGALQRAIKHGAGHPAELDLGKLFLSREMWAEALPHLENSLRGRPADAEVMRLIAAAHYHLKRFDRAAQTYQRAYAVEPAPRTLLSAAIALHAGKKHARAVQLLDRIAPHVAEIPEILFQRALALAALKRPVRPVLERYLMFARGVASEAERIKQAETFLQGPPRDPKAGPPGKPPAPLQPRVAPPAPTPKTQPW